MASFAVPSIDVGGWASSDASRRAAIAAALDDACSRVGFFEITGHGIAQSVIDDMRSATDAFFALPIETKLRLKSPSPEINRGYAARSSESLAYSVGNPRPPDLFEALNIGPESPDLGDPHVQAERHRWFAPNIWDHSDGRLKAALVTYMAEARRVADLLTSIFCAALGLDADFFKRITRHSTDTLRVNHYVTAPGDPDPLEGQLGMGEHTDYGCVTVLFADAVPGLQILHGGVWRDVVPRDGALLVNLGDLTALLTNDRWLSTLHRVLPPVRTAGRANTRRSVAFFFDLDADAWIECLPSCCSDERPARYAGVTAGEHLLSKLLGPRTLTLQAATDTTGGRLKQAQT